MHRFLSCFILLMVPLSWGNPAGASQVCLSDFNPETQRHIEDGPHEQYRLNGTLDNVQDWKKGCMVSSKHYDDKGRIKSQAVWDNKGKLKMEQWSYFENGDLALEYAYSEATGEGFKKNFYKNGQVAKAFEIKSGKIVKYMEYDEQGTVVLEENNPRKLMKILDHTIE